MEKKITNCVFEIKQDSITEDGIFEGYASDYINKKDDYGDIIQKGAFTETIKRGGRNGNGVVMLWQHQTDNPIGVWQELSEQNDKLKVTGKLTLEVQKAKEAYALLKDGAIKGMSIGWDLLRDEESEPVKDAYEIDRKNNIRYLKKLELWEISLVTFPANRRATITSVKGAIEQARNIREFEQYLREEGISNQASKYISSLCKKELERKWNKDIYKIYEAIIEVKNNLKGGL